MEYRIGRKQSLALLTVEGSKQVAMFNKGQEKLAQLVCDLLNQHSANTPVSGQSEQVGCDNCADWKQGSDPDKYCLVCNRMVEL